MRLKRSMAPHGVSHLVSLVAGQVEGNISEHIPGSHQLTFGKLEAKSDDSRRPIETGRYAIGNRDRHKWSHMGTPHPPFNKEGRGERFHDLTYRRELTLRADDT